MNFSMLASIARSLIWEAFGRDREDRLNNQELQNEVNKKIKQYSQHLLDTDISSVQSKALSSKKITKAERRELEALYKKISETVIEEDL